MFPSIDRVYDNEHARIELAWQPRLDFAAVVGRLRAGVDVRGPLSQSIGTKRYHATEFPNGPYPVEPS